MTLDVDHQMVRRWVPPFGVGVPFYLFLFLPPWRFDLASWAAAGLLPSHCVSKRHTHTHKKRTCLNGGGKGESHSFGAFDFESVESMKVEGPTRGSARRFMRCRIDVICFLFVVEEMCRTRWGGCQVWFLSQNRNHFDWQCSSFGSGSPRFCCGFFFPRIERFVFPFSFIEENYIYNYMQ